MGRDLSMPRAFLFRMGSSGSNLWMAGLMLGLRTSIPNGRFIEFLQLSKTYKYLTILRFVMSAQKLVEQKITLDMTIGDVVRDYPAIIPTLLEAGVHCVGCGVAYSETLREGFQGHGMTNERIEG